MSTVHESDVDPIHRISDVARIQAAIQAGVRDALRMHKRAGNPVAEWRDGRVVWIPPEEIPVDDEPGD
jgi:hypothetical protein